MSQSASIEDLFQKTGEYLETRIELVRLKAIDKSSDIISSLVANISIVIVIMLFILTINIGIALWIGDLLGKSFYGFFIVSGFYAIVTILMHVFKDKWIKGPISTLIIDKVIK